MIIRVRFMYWMGLTLFFLGCAQESFLCADGAATQNSSVTLSVVGARGESRDENGNIVYVIDPGQSVKILVTSTGPGSVSGKPKIAGLDQFENAFSGQSSNLVSINGRVTNTVRFEYQLAGSDEGVFALGPSQTNHGQSNTCSIRVQQRTQKEAERDFEQDYRRGVPCQARLKVERETFFLGEDIPVTLEIYCWDENIDIEQIQPQFDGFSVKEFPHSVVSTEVDEKSVRVVQKKYLLSSLRPGVKKIRPMSLVYRVPVQGMDEGFPFGGMHGGFFFGPTRSVKQEEAKTNGLEIIIKELPAAERNADGIGSFSSLVLSLDKNVVTPRTPINLTLKVVGKGNLAQVSAPRLKLPKTLRSYLGTTESDVVKNEATGEFEKRFTYVVQPLKEGNIKIPAQEFLYFDLESESYKTLKSQDVVIIVERDQATDGDGQSPVAPDDKNIQDKTPQETVIPDVLKQHEEQAPPALLRAHKIPWTLWYVLAILLVALGFLYQKIASWFVWHKRNPKRALKFALRDLEKADKNEADQLFGIAIEYFSLKFFSGDGAALPLESIDAVLEQVQFPRGKRLEFMKFLTSLAATAFGSVRGDKHRAAELRLELKRWLLEIDALSAST